MKLRIETPQELQVARARVDCTLLDKEARAAYRRAIREYETWRIFTGHLKDPLR